MHKTNKGGAGREAKLLVDTVDLQDMLGCGRVSAVEIGKAAGAEVRQGRRVLWSVKRIERYIESVAE